MTDEYDAARNGRDSYELALKIKRERGDKHWPVPASMKNGAPPMTNRHIVDQLADVRASIKELKAREDELKDQISKQMGDDDAMGGDEFIALQKVSERKGSIDTKAMEAAGIDPDKFRKKAVTVYSLVVEPRVMEEA